MCCCVHIACFKRAEQDLKWTIFGENWQFKWIKKKVQSKKLRRISKYRYRVLVSFIRVSSRLFFSPHFACHLYSKLLNIVERVTSSSSRPCILSFLCRMHVVNSFRSPDSRKYYFNYITIQLQVNRLISSRAHIVTFRLNSILSIWV